MTKLKLNQVIAIEKGIKSRVYGDITKMHKASQKPALFDGQTRTYHAKDDDQESYPDEKTRVQMNTQDLVKEAGKKLTELFDITATKDFANTSARANLQVNGETLMENVPATYLLFLEKQLNDLHKFVDTMPTLDPNYDWTKDENSGLFKSDVVKTAKTKKVTKPLLLCAPTEHHPAQTDKITEDVVVGHWSQTKISGALPKPRKQELLERIEQLTRAVKMAREEANNWEVEKVEPGNQLLGWLLR